MGGFIHEESCFLGGLGILWGVLSGMTCSVTGGRLSCFMVSLPHRFCDFSLRFLKQMPGNETAGEGGLPSCGSHSSFQTFHKDVAGHGKGRWTFFLAPAVYHAAGMEKMDETRMIYRCSTENNSALKCDGGIAILFLVFRSSVSHVVVWQ